MYWNIEDIPWAKRLKLKHLEIFLLLDYSGSITEAAKQLHLTQPAVSHWLSDLEDVIGMRLFIRGRKLKLSPFGEVFKQYALRTIGDVQRINHELESVKLGAKGRIHIGTIIATAAAVLPKAIPQMHTEYPNIIINISEASFEVLLEKMNRKEIDLILGPLDLRASKALYSKTLLFQDEVVVVADINHPIHKIKANWEETIKYPWILPPSHTLIRTTFEHSVMKAKIEIPQPALETASMISQQALLSSSTYLGLLTRSMARYYESLNIVKIIPLKMFENAIPMGILWDDLSVEATTRRFIQILKEKASSYH